MKTGYSFGSLVSFVEALNAAAVKITGDQTIAGLKTFSSNPITSAAQGSGGGYLTRKDYVDGALALKAPLASPALTGVPTAPTAAAGTNTTQLATTAFVTSANTGQLASAAPLMDGTAAVGTSTLLARQDHIHPTDTSRAPLASPALTGTPTAPTAAAGTNTTQIATTAFVTASNTAQLGAGTPLMDGTAAVGTSTLLSRQDHRHPIDTSRAPLASPALTGTPTAPTAATGTNTTQIATTAFCLATRNAGLASVAPLMDGVATIGSSTLAARQDHVHPTDTTRAPLASPSFTGDVRTDSRFIADGDIYSNATIYGKSSFSIMGNIVTSNTQAGLVVYLGTSTDTKAAMFILCPKYVSTLLNKAGCSGVVRRSRGSVGSSLQEAFVNFTCVSAYNLSSAEIFAQNMGAKIVTTTYNNATYYALWFPAGSSFDYTFEGTRYDKDFRPIFIPDATAYTVTDVVTGESYARLASPSFTGVPTAPTAAAGTNNTQLATTAFVSGAITAVRSSAAPLMDGTASIGTSTLLARQDHVHPADTSKLGLGTATPLMDGTAAVGTSTLGARQDHVHPTDTSRAPLASPALTGTPTAPTATAGTNTTQIATTAFVTSANTAQVGTGTPLMNGTAAVGTSTLLSRQDHIHPTDTSRAPLASPALTGTPTAPTAAAGTNTTQLATTAFVTSAIVATRSDAVPLMSGTAAVGASTQFAREDHVHPADTSKLGLGTAAPLMDGTATVGVSTLGARQDHIHPTDTSRAPLASPGFTGTPTAPTAAAGTNTTQIATTAFVQVMKIEVAKMLYPVGSYYANDSNSTNPATLFGFGTWVRVEGMALMGCDGTGAGTFGTPGNQGGSLTHEHIAWGTALTAAHMPPHSHMLPEGGSSSSVYGIATDQPSVKTEDFTGNTTSTNRSLTSSVGSGASHTHTIGYASSLPPYRVVYLWRRTA